MHLYWFNMVLKTNFHNMFQNDTLEGHEGQFGHEYEITRQIIEET